MTHADTHTCARAINACASKCRFLMQNVRALGSRLEQLLSLPVEVFCFNEVRASHTSIKAMSRVASSLGFASVWSRSPPPTATFSAAPGGTAMFVREPLRLVEQKPHALHKWINDARLCVWILSLTLWGLSLCYLLWLPKSHDVGGQ